MITEQIRYKVQWQSCIQREIHQSLHTFDF